MVLRGRDAECAKLDGLLDAARLGRSSALVVSGEPGVGKTVLLEYALESAFDFQAAKATSMESERELPFAALHQLCRPMLSRLAGLPGPQREALGTALGLSAGGPPDRFLVGLAVLTLLSALAESQPLLCLVDDAQWLDQASAQALAFVARRLQEEAVVMLFATREPGEIHNLTSLPELALEGLPDQDARELLAAAIPGPLDEVVRGRILAEARGNPLALLELPRGFSPGEMAGGFGMPRAAALSSRIEESFRRRIDALPEETQRLLLAAAADPLGDPVLMWRAAEILGIGAAAAAPAEAAGMFRLGLGVSFRHPLVRSAVYRRAAPEDRRAAHRALSEATDAAADPDRRAWHRAQASAGPDEDVARELERSAGRAQARGGLAAAAAFQEEAAVLSRDSAQRARRALAAAQAKLAAGAPEAAQTLLNSAETGPLDDLDQARLERLRGQIAFALRRGSDAPPLLLGAARRLAEVGASLARDTYLEAVLAALYAGRLGREDDLRHTAEAASAAPSPIGPPQAKDLFLDGLVVRFTQGYVAAVPLLKRALAAFRRDSAATGGDVRSLWLAIDLWDDQAWYELASRQVEFARTAGALTVLPSALNSLGGFHLWAGDLAAAEALAAEAQGITEATGNARIDSVYLGLASFRAREDVVSELAGSSRREAAARGEGIAISIAEYAVLVLANALGRYRQALAPGPWAVLHDEFFWSQMVLPEFIEAAARGGEWEAAAMALERLSERARASGTDWALGLEARSRALLSEGPAADGLYREAIERLGRCRIAVHLARTHLIYGEWLRRERRRLDAREQLRTAHRMLAVMGADGFAERAARELLATGEKARRRTVETSRQLTAQETQVARLAREGRSNPEIGAQLFISPRTVEYHLHKVFSKLDISSRSQLDRAELR